MGIARSTFYYNGKHSFSDEIEANLRDRNVNHKVLRLFGKAICFAGQAKSTKGHFPKHPNLIKEMDISGLSQVWLADITYIRIKIVFVYPAAMLDACSRRVIEHAISTRIDTMLTLGALRMAIARRKPGPGVIYHSGQGVQYASTEYVEELKSQGFEISMKE